MIQNRKTPLILKYKSRLITVYKTDHTNGVHWGYEIYPEINFDKAWFAIDACERVCNNADESNKEPKTQEK